MTPRTLIHGVILGAFSVAKFQTLTVIGALGIVLGAAYLLWMFMRVFLGPLNEEYRTLPDMTLMERMDQRMRKM